jgi:hypothetical protein
MPDICIRQVVAIMLLDKTATMNSFKMIFRLLRRGLTWFA